MLSTLNIIPLLISLLSCVTFTLTRAEIYYAIPTSNTTCPDNNGAACTTLSEYASQSNRFTNMDNVTIILLPGSHNLDTKFEITNTTSLVLTQFLNNNKSSIHCGNNSGRFVLHDVTQAVVSNLKFLGCTENELDSVDLFVLEDSFLSGNGRNGSAFKIQQIISFVIVRSTLQSFHGSPLLFDRFGLQPAGGVIVSDNSTILLSDSLFELNTAWNGGVLYATNHSVILVQNSTFSHNNAAFAGGVFFIENSMLSVSNKSSLYQNTAYKYGGVVHISSGSTLVVNDCYLNGNRGDLGGVVSARDFSNVTVIKSVFTDNVAPRSGGVFYATEQSSLAIYDSIMNNNIGFQIGAIIATENSFLKIHSCLCVNNSGVLGFVSLFSTTLEISGDTLFAHNYGSFIMLSSNGQITGNTIFMYNIQTLGSISGLLQSALDSVGGALTLLRSDLTLTDNVQFIHNTAANAGAILLYGAHLVVTKDVYFGHNSVSGVGGAILTFSSEIRCKGNVTIENNVAGMAGGGIHSISSTLDISSGSLSFVYNTAVFGGGLFLQQSAKLYVVKEQLEYFTEDTSSFVEVNFVSNHAERKGGAIYFDDNSSSLVCTNTEIFATESECFIQVLQSHPTLPNTNQFNLRNFYFTNNTALNAGSIVYGGYLDRCTLSVLSEIVYNRIPLPSFNAITYFQTITNAQLLHKNVASEPVRVCFCRESSSNEIIPDCSYAPPPAHIQKGDALTVWVVAVDQTDAPLDANVRAALSSHESGFKIEGQLVQSTTELCTELIYNIVSPESSVELLLHADGPCSNLGRSQSALEVQFLPCECGIGFQPTDSATTCECMCNSLLNQDYVITCENDTLVRGENFWIDYTNVSNHECLVVYPNCPYDYCHDKTSSVGRRVNLNIPNGADEQCAFNHTGILCGACQDGLSLSLGNSNCLKCSNYSLFLLIPFAILGILLVIFILWCNLTVAVGTISGLIFYANVFAVHSSILIPFSSDQNANAHIFYILWINLDWGFPTCFYNGMNSYAKVWLQLAFPLYLIGIVLAIMVISRYSQRFAKLLSNRNPVATLATLILLSYTKILRVLISVLSFARLRCLDGSSRATVWFFDANIPYLTGKHIPLFIMAITIIALSIAYTLLLLFGQYVPHFSKWKILSCTRSLKFTLFMETYHAPYVPKHRYWVGLLLLARVLIYLVASYNPSGDITVSLYFVLFVTMGLLVISKLGGRVYKSWALDVLDTSVFMNIVLLSVGTLYVTEKGGNQRALVSTSLFIVVLTLVCIFVYHTYKFVFLRTSQGRFCKTRLYTIYNEIKPQFVANKDRAKFEMDWGRMESSTMESSAVLRESILELAADYHLVENGTPTSKVVAKKKPSFTVVDINASDRQLLSAEMENRRCSEKVESTYT